jgi:hypothetical protein
METLEPAFVEFLEALTPKAEYLRLFRAIVMDVWEQNQSDAKSARRNLQRRVDEIHERKDRLRVADGRGSCP